MMADGLETMAIGADAADEAVIELLTRRGKLDEAGVQRVRRVQTDGGEGLHSLLVKLGMISELDMAEALAHVLALPLASQQDFPDQPLLDGVLSQKFQKDSRVLPLSETADEVVLAMADPLDGFAAGAVAIATGRTVLRRVATPADREGAGAAVRQERQRAQRHRRCDG
jgi:general secretion pathway protein E